MDAQAMNVVILAAAFAAGAALGAAHFGSLWWSVALMRNGRTGLGVAVQALRLVVLTAVLVLIVRRGAGPFLSAAAGVLAARMLLMRRYRRLA